MRSAAGSILGGLGKPFFLQRSCIKSKMRHESGGSLRLVVGDILYVEMVKMLLMDLLLYVLFGPHVHITYAFKSDEGLGYSDSVM